MEFDPQVLKKNAQTISNKFGNYGISYDDSVYLLYRFSFDPTEVVAHIERAKNGGEDPVGKITEKESKFISDQWTESGL